MTRACAAGGGGGVDIGLSGCSQGADVKCGNYNAIPLPSKGVTSFKWHVDTPLVLYQKYVGLEVLKHVNQIHVQCVGQIWGGKK